MTSTVFRNVTLAAAAAFLLPACESARFGSGRLAAAAPPPVAQPAPTQLEPPQPAVPPSGVVIAEPLPPPTVPGLSPPPPATPTQPGSAAPPGATLPASAPETPPTPSSGPRPQLAAAPPTATPASAGPSASRSNLTGSWSARDGAGGTCRVSLSSSPALDLYKASAGACPNKDLARVNAWEYRDGEIYLYSAGAVVARLQAQGSRTASGALVRSGAPLTLTR
jgi:hypothetical protein